MKFLGKTILVLLALAFLFAPTVSFGEDFPTKPITLVITFAPGGTVDGSARILAAKAEKVLGQPIIVTNVGGGGGSVALGQVAHKPADGYTITACTSTGLVRLPQLRELPYGPDDFVPIMHYTSVQSGVVVKSDSPFKTFKDLVEYARQNPGKVNYGSSGAGSPMHMSMEYVAGKEGIKWTHVPFPGGGPELTAVLGGHITAMVDSTEWLPHVKDGALRLLVTHGEKRMKAFPDVPTLRDLGYDFINETVFMIAAPKGVPAPIVAKLDNAFKTAMDDPEFVKIISTIEFDASYRGSADTQKYLDEAYTAFGEMIKKMGIQKAK